MALEKDRSNQGGEAAFKAYVENQMELVPYSGTPFGRGKCPGFGQDVDKYAVEGFLLARTEDSDDEDMPFPWRVARDWREHIEDSRAFGTFPLDFNDPKAIAYHNDAVIGYWLHKGLLVENIKKLYASYNWPKGSPTSKYYPVHKYIGANTIYGDLHYLYSEENFPGMLTPVQILLDQETTPVLPFPIGGTDTTKYPTGLNYQ